MTYADRHSISSESTTREAAVGPATAMFDHELIRAVLGWELSDARTARLCDKIFELFSGRALSPVTSEEISSSCNLPDDDAARLSAAVELARRLLWPDDGDRSIRSPRDACRAAGAIRSADREHFLALYLNARNVVIHEEIVSVGSLNANIVHPREVFRPAITRGAAAIILAHNHPSGDVTPSREDLNLTARLVEAGRLLGIEVLDHLIVAESRYLSFRSESYL
ncbi:MAG: DNA repair protein RadC [Actinobacteria bacterium]|nr:DNA repair protein RadC [Actinomycetota bacterium]MCL5883398.1 DNA repair protein RadC [Actinomycetota bacterium]